MTDERATPILMTRIAAVAATAVVAFIFLSRFPIPLTLAQRYIPALAGVLAVLSAAWFLGQASITVCTRFLGQEPGSERSLTDSTLVGIPIFGTLIGAIAWTGISIQIIIPLVTLLLAAAGIVPLARRVRHAHLAATRIPAILLPPAVLATISALMPVNSPDELIYKLSVPKAWLAWGRMIELPLNSQSYFPASISSANLGSLTLSGYGSARVLHLVLFFLALRVVWRLGEHISIGSGPWAATIFAGTPALLIIAGWAWADWGLLGLLLLSWHRFRQFIDDDDRVSGTTAALALAGAISAKYTAGPWLALFVPIAAIVLFRKRRKNFGRTLLGFFSILAIFGGFFYLRNFIWTGSPVAPFGLLGSPAVSGFRSANGGWWELLHGFDVLNLEIIDDSLGMLLPVSVLLSPFALLILGRRHFPFFLFGVVQTAWLVTLAPMSRLLVPGLAPLVLLGAAAGQAAFQSSKRMLRVVASTLIGGMLAAQLVLAMFTFVTTHEPFKFLVGGETEEQYLDRMRPFIRPYAWIHENTPADSVILMLGQTHAWHLNRRAHWAGNLDGPRVAAWLGQARSIEALRQQFDSLEITHILIHKKWYQIQSPDEADLEVLDKELALRVPPETDRILRNLLRDQSVQRFEDKLHLIFELSR